MAGVEGNRTTGEKVGRGALVSGVVIGALGLIGMWAGVPNSEKAALAGGGLAVSGEIFRRVSKPK